MILTSLKYQIVAYALAATLVAASMSLVFAKIEVRHLKKVNTRLEQLINDPATGYVAKLAQSHSNAANLEARIEQQNQAFLLMQKQGAEALAATVERLAVSQKATKAAEARAAALLSRAPQGVGLEARVSDVDARVLEALK